GELVVEAAGAACPPDTAHRFLLDDEGHVWSGRPLEPAAVRPGVHAACLDERARSSACGAGHAPSWELVAQEVDTVPRADWLARAGRGGPPVELEGGPAQGPARWTGDLDGDGELDWCAGTPTGARCGRAAERAADPDGALWTFYQGGVPAAFPAAPSLGALGALADVDGDRLADLCTVQQRRIVCTRSQRYGFGPAVPIAELPPGPPARALWVHGASLCVDDGEAIHCTRRMTSRPP
ncbi:MAG TPA: hypothetical protein VN253_04450, partial [Kofleriaceae bacterium]|nr:hypothetical protein [Kofleriaceae bacterium]